MFYVEPPPGDWDRLERALASGELDDAVDQLVGLALHDGDWRRVQDQCLTLLDHDDRGLRRLAATCLGHVARLHGELDEATVVELWWRIDDPVIGGHVEDALDDYEVFVARRRREE